MAEEQDAKDLDKTKSKAKRPATEEVEREEQAAPEEPPEPEQPSGDHPLPEELDEEDERGIFGRFTRKLRDRKELSEDAWKAVGAVISTSDKAKSDFIRMMGREVRHYLDGLQLTDDLRDLVTSHSLEVRASLHLKPLAKEEPAEAEEE